MGPAQTTLAISVACLLSALSLLLTWRRLEPMAPARRTLLLGLRGLALVCLIAILADPVSTRSETAQSPSRVAVLLDRSASMSRRDAPGGRARLDWALDLLRPGGPGNALLAKAEVSRLLFAEGVTAGPPATDPEPSGQGTDLGAGLAAALSASAEPPDAVVLLSDGAANQGLSADALAAWVGRQRVPIYCLGVGTQKRPRDAWLGAVDAPREVKADHAATITATLGARGFGGQAARVLLSVEGIGSQQQQVVLASGARRRVQFAVRPPRPGLYQCKVRLEPLAGEWTEANNTRSFFLRVAPGAGRLLLVAGRPGREYKFIRRVLDGAPDVRVTYLVRKSGRSFWEEGDQLRRDRRLPAGSALNEYDAVILCDVPSAAFDAAELQRLTEFVRTRGGGLGMTGGEDSFGGGGYGDSPLAAALGVRVPGASQFAAVPTKVNARSPGAEMSPVAEIQRQDGFPGWSAMPLLAGLNEVGGVKPGASVLLVAPSGQPLLVIQRYGRGRTLCWMGASTYRWVLSKDATTASREGHAVFWTGIAAWLTTPPNRAPVALETDRDVYESGETARLIVQVSDQGFQPVSGAKVAVRVADPKGETTETTLAEVAGAVGRYEGSFTVGQAGTQKLEARATAGGAELGTDRRQVIAEAPRRELADPAQNVGLLKAIAAASGGAYLAAEDVARLPDVLRLAPATEVVSTRRHWARSLSGLLGFLTLVGLDWFLRRWWGVG